MNRRSSHGQQLLAESYRVLRPGGKVLVVLPSKYNAVRLQTMLMPWRRWWVRERRIGRFKRANFARRSRHSTTFTFTNGICDVPNCRTSALDAVARPRTRDGPILDREGVQAAYWQIVRPSVPRRETNSYRRHPAAVCTRQDAATSSSCSQSLRQLSTSSASRRTSSIHFPVCKSARCCRASSRTRRTSSRARWDHRG